MSESVYEDSNVITLHFDVPDHAIRLEHFYQAAQGTQKIIKNLNAVLYKDHSDVELMLLPYEPGGWVARILFGIGLVGITADRVIYYLEIDIGKGVVQEITGHLPANHAKNIVKWIEGTSEKNKVQTGEVDKAAYLNGDKVLADYIVREFTEAILKKNVTELEKIGIKTDKFALALQGKNQFYRSCEENVLCKAVGFDQTDNFDVRRENFSTHVMKTTPVESLSASINTPLLMAETLDLEIYSPNWNKKSRLKWGGVIKPSGEDLIFDVTDKEFWTLVKEQNIRPGAELIDRAKMQCIYSVSQGKKEKAKAIKVISYNGFPISEALSDEELQEHIKSQSICKIDESVQLDWLSSLN